MVTDGAIVLIENLLDLVLAGRHRAAGRGLGGCDILWLIVTATATESDVRCDLGQTLDDGFVERMRTTFAALPPKRFPHVVADASFAIDTFLDGLVARSARG